MVSLRLFFSTLLDAVFPRACLGCGAMGDYMCEMCVRKLPPPEDIGARGLTALFSYRDPLVKKAVWSLKYRGCRDIARIFAQELAALAADVLSEEALMRGFVRPLLVPVPLAKKRERERGFNQSALIARELARLLPECELTEAALVRQRETKPQAELENKTERLENVLGCFATRRPGLVAGRNIVLIDDVSTTGATLKEAKKVLKEAGARSVLAFTVAH